MCCDDSPVTTAMKAPTGKGVGDVDTVIVGVTEAVGDIVIVNEMDAVDDTDAPTEIEPVGVGVTDADDDTVPDTLVEVVMDGLSVTGASR